MRKIVAAVLVLAPSVARADEFSGLGAVVAGMFVGVPLGLLLAGLIIASIVIGARPDARRGRRRYAGFAIVASAVAAPLYVLATCVLDSSSRAFGVAVLFSTPLLALAAASIGLAIRVLRKNRAA